MNPVGSVRIEILVSPDCNANICYRGYGFQFEFTIWPKYPYTAPKVYLAQY